MVGWEVRKKKLIIKVIITNSIIYSKGHCIKDQSKFENLKIGSVIAYSFIRNVLNLQACQPLSSKVVIFKYSSGQKGLDTQQSVCSKTPLVTSSVSGAGVNPPPRKINTFFHRSLALSVPIYGNFQSNGVNWRSIKR